MALGRLSRIAAQAGSSLFQGVFLVAAILASTITFLTITGANPASPIDSGIYWLFGFNFVFIAGLAWLVFGRYQDLQWEGGRRGRLVRRFLLMFSLSAVVPATVVAIFLGGTITRALDNWFGERVETLVEQTADLARENFEQTFIQPLRYEALALESDISSAADVLVSNEELFNVFLFEQSIFRQLLATYIIDETGELVASAAAAEWDGYENIAPSEADLAEARLASPLMRLHERAGLTTALVPLEAPSGRFLFILKSYDPATFQRLREAEAAVIDYRGAKGTSQRLLVFFIVGYAQIAALALLLFARLGLEAAGRITGPIRRLAVAAKSVRDGQLHTRVIPPGGDDEIDALTQAFNAMTAQLGEQRTALETAKTVSEDRRQFLETLMAEMSAGVIRTDDVLQITLANRSAEALIGEGPLLDRALGDVVPEFKKLAISTVSEGLAGDASIELSRKGEGRHIRLRTSTDGAGGCVLTFDDATRLVNAQRHLAWRDVARRVAHEIRNPLTPILLSAERLRRRYRNRLDEGDDVFDRSLETIIRQVSDIGRMVESFSNFARMPKPLIAPFSISEMLDEIAFSERMVAPDIDIEVARSKDDVLFAGDQRLLAQAFSNLIKNAVEAIGLMPQEDEVRGHILIQLTTDGNTLLVSIEDNGPGFPAQNREELLEPYVTTRERGSGLGLAIVNRIIMDHSGSISLQSRLDGMRGARVQVQLPMREWAQADQPSSSEDAQRVEEEVS